jgi:hypothetical protein
MKVIGITGKAGSGKDWLAGVIRSAVAESGFVYLRYAFAWPIKNELIARGECTFDEAHFTKPARVRDRLQQFGTEQGRNVYGEGYWLRHADNWLRLFEGQGVHGVVIPDCRFANEIEWVHARGGKVVRMLHGPGRPYPLEGTPYARHSSECAADGVTVDAEIVNGVGMTADAALRRLYEKGVLR